MRRGLPDDGRFNIRLPMVAFTFVRCTWNNVIALTAVMSALLGLVGCGREDTMSPSRVSSADMSPETGEGQTIRCAVIGGLADTGLWEELGERFTAESGHKLVIVARGPKREVLQAFVDQHAHVVAMHACDAIINTVADGHAVDPQPWARNDFVIVGPPADPAGIRNMTNAGEALRKVVESKSKLLIHASAGSMEVLHDLLEAEQLELDAEHTLVRPEDRHRQMLMFAGQQQAYTIVGRIPFLSGKLPKQDLEILAQGDEKLRRPYLIALAAGPASDPAMIAAAQWKKFVRSPPAQAFIAEYGRGRYDDRPLFFQVVVPSQ